MPSFVTFNGITRFLPGGITKVNTDALNAVVAGENSIVALVGEADGGAPGTQGLVTLFDDTRALSLFRSGPIVNAVPLAFQSANDENVPGGASRAIIYKTNNSTQATLSLPADNADNVIGTPAAPGTTTGGSATTLIDTTLASTFADDELNGMWIVLRPFAGDTEVRQIADYDAGTQTMTIVGTDWTAVPVTDDYLVLENEVLLTGALDAASTSTIIEFKVVTGFTVNEHAGRWLFIQDASAVTFIRQITGNTATTLTVSPALPAAPTAGAYAEILANVIDLTSVDWGLHTNGITADPADGVVVAGSKVVTLAFEGEDEISPEVGGAVFFNLLYRGGAEAIGDTVDGIGTTTVFELQTGGLTPSAHIGTQVLVNGELTTITANSATQLTVSPPLTTAPGNNDDVSIRTVTAGVVEVTGASGVATNLLTRLTGVVGDNLGIEFTPNMTLRDLVDHINANVNYLATVPNNVNADVALAADFDFGPRTIVSVLNSENIATDGLFQNLVALVNYFNSFSELSSATRSTADSSEGCCSPAAFGAGQEPASFAGGARGISLNSDFQAGLDELLKVRANSVVPLIDQDLTNEGFSSTATIASVAAQLSSHVATARTTAQNTAGERGGFIGKRGTKAEVIEQANALNDFDIQLVPQNPTALNASGSLVVFGPRELAVMGASMRAGVIEVGEPLTHKDLRISGIDQDSSWDPTDLTDANDMVINGILFVEPVEGQGFRWVRDITTHIKDNNLAKSEGSVRDIVRFIAFGLRKFLVDIYTGRKATPATVSSVKDDAATFLEQQRSDNLIVDSTDPATQAVIRAFHNLKVTSSGDTLTLNVGFFPAPGINFILNELFVQLAQQAA